MASFGMVGLDWQERIKNARAEFEQVQLMISQAKQQFDAFAAVVGKGRP